MSRIHILKGFSGIEGALWVLKFYPGLPSRQEMARTATQNGYVVTNKRDYDILQVLGEWELADVEKRQFTSRGKEFYSLWEMKRDVAIDVLHGLQYSLWTEHAPDQNLASWAYQRVCNYLWEYHILPKPQDLITYIYDNREDLGVIRGDIANAFSSKSVNGAYDWMLPLSPPVFSGVGETATGRRNFTKAVFTRRSYCSAALFLMGLDWVAREAKIKFGEPVEINDMRRTQVCCFCLLEESGFDFMLNETLRRFAFLSVEQIGRLFIIINRTPKIADF